MYRKRRITSSQRSARRKNIAIARQHKKKRGLRKIDKVIKKYVDYFGDKRPKKPPVKNIVFRTASKKELSSIRKGKGSGKFWSSDPSEYGRYAMGSIGKRNSDSVLIVAKSSKRNRSYRGLGGTKDRHFQEINTRRKRNIVSIYKWNGRKLKRKRR